MQLKQKKIAFSDLKEQERETRRNIIIAAAEEVFATRPFSRVNMRDIAQEAGISPALIYRYFSDQQHLYVETFLQSTQRFIETFEAFIDRTSEISIEDAATQIIAYTMKHEQYYRLMPYFMLTGALNSELIEKLNAVETAMMDMFDRLFRKIGVEENTRVISQTFYAALSGILITFGLHPGRSEQEVRDQTNRFGRIIARLFEQALAQGKPGIFT